MPVRSALLLSCLSTCLLAAPTLANPIQPATDGTGTQVTPTDSRYDITGGSVSGDGANLFHSFEQFGLSAGEVANFITSPAIENILGRIGGGQASIIDGLLQVSGSSAHLYLINPAGILFGPNAALNLDGSFTATTASALGFDGGWLAAVGSDDYTALVGDPSSFAFTAEGGIIANTGALAVAPRASLTLVGGSVINTGTLSAPGGRVTIAAVPGENLVRISQEQSPLSLELATLPGELAAAAAATSLAPVDLPSLLTGAPADVAADIAVNPDGSVSLVGAAPVEPSAGTALVAGAIDVAAETGGSVAVLGERVGLQGATIDASGERGGGTVWIGGDYQGGAALPAARQTLVDSASTITADATGAGDGGLVVLWAEEATTFGGTISARGSGGGDGGLVEVSGLQTLNFQGDVDAAAPGGTPGTLLLDPTNIFVVGEGQGTLADVDEFADPDLDVNGTTISAAFINEATANVVLQATNVISFEADVNIAAPGVGLTATAGGGLLVASNITTSGGDVTLVTTAGGLTVGVGDFAFAIATNGGNISLLGSGAEAGVTLQGAVLDSGGGAVIVEGNGGGLAVDLANSDILSAGGGIQLTGTTIGGEEISVSASNILSAGGAVTLSGSGGGEGGITLLNNSLVDAGAGRLDVVTDLPNFSGGTVFAIGELQIAPATATLDLVLGGPVGTGFLDQFDLAGIGGGFSQIVIGRADGSGAITTAGDITFLSPVQLLAPADGGTIATVGGTLSFNPGGALSLTAADGVTLGPIATNGGDLTVIGDQDADGAGAVAAIGAIATAGGDIFLRGASTQDDTAGVFVGAEISSGGGDISFSGQSTGSDPTLSNGVALLAPVTSGNGDIDILGSSAAANDIALLQEAALDAGSGIITLNTSFSAADVPITASLLRIVSPGDLTFGGLSDTQTAVEILATGSITTGDLVQTAGQDLAIVSDSGTIQTGSITNPGGAVSLSAPGAVVAGNIDTSAVGVPGGNVTVVSGTSITTGNIDTSSNLAAGNVLLDPPGPVEVGFIDATGAPGGSVTVFTDTFFRATGSFVDPSGQLVSISTALNGGNIVINHGGGDVGLPFTIGDASLNGTAAGINSGRFSLAGSPVNAIFGPLILGEGQPGAIGLITAEVPEVPPQIVDPVTEREIDDGTLPNLSEEGAEAAQSPAPVVITAEAAAAPETVIATTETQFISDLRAYYSEQAVIPEPGSFSLADTQRSLRELRSQIGQSPALVFVTFGAALGSEDTLIGDANPLELVLVTPEGDPIYRQIPEATRRQVLDTVERLRRQITDPNLVDSNTYLVAAQRLYRWLIEPLVADLEAADITNLSFVMPEGLRLTPLAALHDGQQFLIERYSLALMPSVSLTDLTYRPLQDTSVLLGGASQFVTQEPLYATPIERDLISSLWPSGTLFEAEFTTAALKQERQETPYGIIHLATHGEFVRGKPEDSYLQFSDGRLRLNQVRELGWNDPAVELVVLSACRTALGHPDAELGLAGLAVASGARSALASLWRISDESTPGLMAEFYQQLSDGSIKAEALRQAQLALLRGDVYTADSQLIWSGGAVDLPPALAWEGRRDFSHPYFWGAFTLIGNPW